MVLEVIPDVAVEAAAKALWELVGWKRSYEEASEGTRRRLRREARGVLEAAVPHLMAARCEEASTPRPALPVTEWGTNHWGEILSEPTEGHARGVARTTGAKVYSRSPMGEWVEDV